MISPERREWLMAGKVVGYDRPTYLPAWLACELQTDDGRYSRVIWSGDAPGGFDRFIWVHGLNIMFMNAQDTAFDVAGMLAAEDIVLMFGVDVPVED